MPNLEAVCEEHNLYELVPFMNRLFRLKQIIDTFHGVPDFIKPLTYHEILGLVIIQDEINRFEQNELKKEQAKWQNSQSQAMSRLR